MKESKKSSAADFIKKMAGFSVSTWINAGISFISIPIITRLFLPDDVGKINMFVTYLSLLYMLVFLGLDQAYVRFYYEPPQKYNQKQLFKLCVFFSGIATIILCLVLLLFKDFVSKEIVGIESTTITICFIFDLCSNVILRFLTLAYRMKKNIFWFNLQSIVVTLVGKFFFVIIAFWKPTYLNAIIVMTIGYMIVTILFVFLQRKEIFGEKLVIKKEASKTILKFGLPLVPVSLLSWLNSALPQIMLKKYISYSAIGVFSNAITLANMITLLQAGFNTYWAAFAYENYKKEQKKIQKVHHMITFCMILFGLLLILFDDLIYFIIGGNFKESKVFFPLLLIAPICYTIAETTGLGINISRKSYLNLVTFLCNTLTNICLNIFLLPKIGIVGAAISIAISGVVMLIVKTIIGERYYKCITNKSKTFIAVTIIVVAAFLNLYLVNIIIIKFIINTIFIIVLLILYKDETKYLLKVFKNFKFMKRE